VAAGSVHTLQHELHQAHVLSEHRSREVAQLREVSAQADHALQQCLAQLQVYSTREHAKPSTELIIPHAAVVHVRLQVAVAPMRTICSAALNLRERTDRGCVSTAYDI